MGTPGLDSGRFRSQLLVPFVRAIAQRGGDVASFLSRAGLPPDAASAAHVELPVERMAQLTDFAAQAAGDPLLGLHVAQTAPRGIYGLLEFACRHAATVGEALDRLARYVRILNEAVRFSFTPVGEAWVLSHATPGVPECLGRQGNEFVMALLVVLGRELTGGHFQPEHVWFTHPAPPQQDEVARFFATRVTFGQPDNGFLLSRPACAVKLLTAEPALLEVLDRYAQDELARLPPEDLVNQVRELLRRTLQRRPPALADVARHLGTSQRSLQRRLSEAGLTFEQLLNQVRHELALTYVKRPELGLAEIAFLLGFSDLSPFLRAFKRWTGRTPREYRRALAG